MDIRRRSHDRRVRFVALAVTLAAVLFGLAGPVARPAAAAVGIKLDAHGLLGGHARVGSWMGIAITVANDGPALTGELRLAAGSSGTTRFSLPVDLPTGSRKDVELYAQPPAFGQALSVDLVTASGAVASAKIAFTAADSSQLTVAVIAEKPQTIVSALRLPVGLSGSPPLIVPLKVEDLPGRVEGWDPIDRIVWQDTDSASLRPDQLAALRGWIAAGGRLTIVGGTSGSASLARFPDDLLPYRPDATTDVPPSVMSGLVGSLATAVTTIPALTGARDAVRGRTLAASGDRVIAAEVAYGSGAVTLVGVDPTGDWLARTAASDALWARLVPNRTNASPLLVGDDSQLVSALNTLPSLALPPLGGLLVLLAGYILLVGPVNYLVLRRLDRREWAWLTMPLLVVGFAVGAYLYGDTLRGGQVILNELAIVRGAPGTTDAAATAYVGVFSPTRQSYQLAIPGGALLSAPTSGDTFTNFGGTQGGGTLDIVQGDTARVRDLAVGYGALRAVRAEAPISGPQISADLHLEGDHLVGTVTNASTMTLERPAVVLGGAVAVLPDLAPAASAKVDVQLTGNNLSAALGTWMFGGQFFGGGIGSPSGNNPDDIRTLVRQSLVNQLTYDPMTGMQTNLSADGAVFLAFGRGEVLGARLDGTIATTTGNVLYYVPIPLSISGKVVFTADLMAGTVLSSDNQMFGKGDPSMIVFSGGTLIEAYRPPSFAGSLTASHLYLASNTGGGLLRGGIDVSPIESGDTALTEAEQAQENDGMPWIELFDRQAGAWVRFAHLTGGATMSVAEPARYVDPTTGTVLVRFRSSNQGGIGFSFAVQLEGTIQ